jgi:hypothetical protein
MQCQQKHEQRQQQYKIAPVFWGARHEADTPIITERETRTKINTKCSHGFTRTTAWMSQISHIGSLRRSRHSCRILLV